VQNETRRVHYSAPLLTLLLATPTLAQVIPTGSPAADILLATAIAEQRVFLTCSALDPEAHGLIAMAWAEDIARAAAILTENAVPAEAIAAFTAAAAPTALLPTEDTAFVEVMRFCDTHRDWPETWGQFNFTILDLKLPGAFE
jgi:hypothetical protein